MVNFTLLEEKHENITFRLTFDVYRQGITQGFKNLGSHRTNTKIEEELVVTTYSMKGEKPPKLDRLELDSKTLALEKIKVVEKQEKLLNIHETTLKIFGTSGSKTGPASSVLRYEIEDGAQSIPHIATLVWSVESSFSLSTKSLYFGDILDPAHEVSKRVVITSTDPTLHVTGLESDEYVHCVLKKTLEGSVVEVKLVDHQP